MYDKGTSISRLREKINLLRNIDCITTSINAF